MTHICVSKLNIIGSDNGLSCGRRQAIIWTNTWILLIGHLRTNFREIPIGPFYIFIEENALKCRLRNGRGMSYINSLWPGDAIWRHGTRSTLAQVMACCLTALSHYLSQCWLIIGEVPWHSSQGIIIRRCEDSDQWKKIENCSFTMASRSPSGQWLNTYQSSTT